MRTAWRVELPNWSGIPVAARRLYLRIVGDYGGEWWGAGRAEFDNYPLAEACVKEIGSELGLEVKVIFWLRAERMGRA